MTEKFTVCISRQYGSGGREVGQLLAQKLGVTCYDKLLIREAARESHLAESYLEQNEERLTDEYPALQRQSFCGTWRTCPGCFTVPGTRPIRRKSGPWRPSTTGSPL